MLYYDCSKMSNQKIVLDVSPILNSKIGSSLKFKINPEIIDIDNEVKLSGKITGQVIFSHLEKDSLTGLFNLNLVLNLECARCLKRFNKNINLSYEQKFSGKKGDDVLPINHDKTVDLYPSIRQEILMAIPTIPLCKKVCKGIRI